MSLRLVVLTANYPRHAALVSCLEIAGHSTYTVVYPKPPYPDGVYWECVTQAEQKIFGECWITSPMTVYHGGPLFSRRLLNEIRESDAIVVFGAPYIRGDDFELLDERGALNLHAGIAPEYRGSACNFWAEYDGHPELVGAQVQQLCARLDSGEILQEVRPPIVFDPDPFVRGMRAVQLGIKAMVHQLEIPPDQWKPIRPNDPAKTIRYSRKADLTPEILAEYMARLK